MKSNYFQIYISLSNVRSLLRCIHNYTLVEFEKHVRGCFELLNSKQDKDFKGVGN